MRYFGTNKTQMNKKLNGAENRKHALKRQNKAHFFKKDPQN